jgi:hypothetical protein
MVPVVKQPQRRRDTHVLPATHVADYKCKVIERQTLALAGSGQKVEREYTGECVRLYIL